MQTIGSSLETLASFAGVVGCALVESDTGMVWHYAGKLTDMELVGEAAVEFWRTQRRIATQLSTLGDLQFATFKYAQGTIGLVPCDDKRGLILVCLANSQGVVWSEWISQLPMLRQAVKAYVAQPTAM
jgi:predicted regulator of Ras-like GTPase activity (Roadblock/LC7/MglB family)